MFNRFSLATTAIFFTLLACSNSQGGSASQRIPTGMQGVWIEKSEVQELRSTGTIQSTCEEVKKNPKTTVMNVRLVEPSGDVYVYYPRLGKRPDFKMGNVSANGNLTLSETFFGYTKDSPGHLTINNDSLTISFGTPPHDLGIEYLRSTESEATAYYSVQEKCRQ